VTETPRVLSEVPLVLDGLPVRVDRDEVLRFQGYKKGLDIPTADVLALLDDAVSLGERLMVPRVVYRSVPVTAQSADVLEAEASGSTFRDRAAVGPLRRWAPGSVQWATSSPSARGASSTSASFRWR
jgi:hypothetical protein